MNKEVIRNVDTRYVYTENKTVMLISKIRRALRPNEKLYVCEVFGVSEKAIAEEKKKTGRWYETESTILERLGMLKGTPIATVFGNRSYEILRDNKKDGPLSISRNGTEYDLYVNLIGATEVERDEKDKAKEEQMKKDNYTKNIVNTFYAPSINAVLEKYGLMYDKEKGGVIFEANSFNSFMRNILENNLVKELAELGIEVKINDKLAAKFQDGVALRKVIYKKDMKIIQEKED